MTVTNSFLKLFLNIFQIPGHEELAIKELNEAKRELLHMQTAQNYSNRMVEYHADRIKRLTAYINEFSYERNCK